MKSEDQRYDEPRRCCPSTASRRVLGECRKIVKQQSLVIVRKWFLEGAGKAKGF